MQNGFDFETVAQAERAISSMFARGTDGFERLMARATIRERGDVENRCEVFEDSRCERRATRTVEEPYTPARIKVECCDEHAADLIAFGYKALEATQDGRRDEDGRCWRCGSRVECSCPVTVVV